MPFLCYNLQKHAIGGSPLMTKCLRKPIHLRMQKSLDIPLHRHLYPELLYQISGSSIYTVGKRQFKLQSQDIVITNTFTPHSISQSNGYQARFLLNFSYNTQSSQLQLQYFRGEPEPQCEALQLLRRAVLRFILFTFQSSPTALDETGKEILSMVFKNFSIEQPAEGPDNPYIQNALEFMVQHHSEPIQIQDIADACGITHTHLTRIFQRDLELSPSKCLQDIRIEHAQQLLESQNLRPIEIAEQVGFTSLRAFRTAFEARQGMTPREWQRYAFSSREQNLGDPSLLCTILQEDLNILVEKSPPIEKRSLPSVSCAQEGSPLPNTLFTLLAFHNISYLHFPLYRKCIKDLQILYEFRDFLVTGLLESGNVRWKKSDSDILWDFTLMDVSLSHILSLGMKPFFRLSEVTDTSMPSGLMPSGSWELFLRALFSHLQHHYGNQELAQWHFSIHQLSTDEGNISSEISAWEQHCRFIRSICPSIPLGSPLICDAAAAACFRSGRSHTNTGTDFIICTGEWFDGAPQPVYQLNQVGKFGDCTGDTITQAANLAAQFCYRLGKVDAMACYPLIDDMFFSQDLPEFYGGSGLLSRNTFPKSSMLVFRLFRHLGPILLRADRNICVTRSDNGFQVLLWNNRQKAKGSDETPPLKLEVSIQLEDITPATYRLRTTTVNAMHGCAFEEWKRMGFPDLSNPSDATYFEGACYPKQTFSTIHCEHSYLLTHVLEPDEIYLATFWLAE